jgi:hypothetical protein
VIAQAARGELADWSGLGSETIESVLAALSPVTGVQGPEDRERRIGRFAHYQIARSTPPSAVEVWIPVGAKEVALIELDDPAIGDVDRVLDQLGRHELVERGQRWLEGHWRIRAVA